MVFALWGSLNSYLYIIKKVWVCHIYTANINIISLDAQELMDHVCPSLYPVKLTEYKDRRV